MGEEGALKPGSKCILWTLNGPGEWKMCWKKTRREAGTLGGGFGSALSGTQRGLYQGKELCVERN